MAKTKKVFDFQIARITSLKGFDGVLLGRDMSKVFKEGHVYGAQIHLGEIVLTDLGLHAENELIGKGARIDQIAVAGTYCLTKDEYKKELERNDR